MAISISSPPAPIPRPRARSAISMFIVEKGTPGFTVGRALDKTGWRSLRHRRAGVRGLPRAGREPAGRAQPRLLLDHGQLPERAAGDRRHGHGRGAEARSAHARVRERTARPSARRCGTSRRSASACRDAGRRSRRRASSCYHTAWLDAQGATAWREVSMVKALAAIW